MNTDIDKRERLYNLIIALYNGKKLRYTTGEYIVLGEPSGRWEAAIWCGGGHHIPWKEHLGAHKLASKLLAQPQQFKAESDTEIINDYICSSCGDTGLIPVIWGLVEAETGCAGSLCEENIKLLEQEDRGEVYLGGCVSDSFWINGKEPTHWCKSCSSFNLVKGE